MSKLEKAQSDLKEKQHAFEEAAAQLEEARTHEENIRVSEMDGGVVQQARDLGINPGNFDDTHHLQQAIDSMEGIEPSQISALTAKSKVNLDKTRGKEPRAVEQPNK